MNFADSFNNFYNNLSSDSLFFFWIIVFLLVFLLFLSIVLIVKNRKLLKLIRENKSNISDEINNNLVLDKEEIKTQEKPIVLEKENDSRVNEIKEEEKKEEIIQKDSNIEKAYKKNVLREMSTRTQTSPIHIDKKEDKDSFNNYIDISDITLSDDNISPLKDIEDNYEFNENMAFTSDIIKKMEEEIKPSNIELTDYEKKQEEEAIISYDELLKVKDRIYNITEDEETDEFIDELKSFRLDL